MSSIMLSKKHGLNPTIPVCFYCGEEKNQIVFLGNKGEKIAESLGCSDGQMPMRCCLDKNPCKQCEEYMKQGIIFISVRDGETNRENPYRTGGFWVLKEDAVIKMLSDSKHFLEAVLKSRVCFIEDKVAIKIGLEKHE